MWWNTEVILFYQDFYTAGRIKKLHEQYACCVIFSLAQIAHLLTWYNVYVYANPALQDGYVYEDKETETETKHSK